MKLVQCGMDISLEDNAHMRDALSRVVVEMIKREWPQQWSTLLAELNQCAAQGNIQTELVLLVLLRLVEDVAVLQVQESLNLYLSFYLIDFTSEWHKKLALCRKLNYYSVLAIAREFIRVV